MNKKGQKRKHENVNVRCTLRLPLWWRGFLPERKKDRITFAVLHGGARIDVELGIIDRKCNVCNPATLPNSLENSYFPGKALTCWFTLPLPKTDIPILRSKGSTPELVGFRKAIEEIINLTYGRVIELIRNHFKQYWISPKLVAEKKAWISSEWLDTNHKWKEIFASTLFIESRIRLATGLSQNDWWDLGRLLKEDYQTNIVEVLIANAQALVEVGDSRSAIVEAVAALEAAIKRLLPRMLHDRRLSNIPLNKIKTAIEKLGLRLSAEILLKYQRPDLRLRSQDCDLALEAVEVRNNLLHGGKKTSGVQDTEDMVQAISRIICALEKAE